MRVNEEHVYTVKPYPLRTGYEGVARLMEFYRYACGFKFCSITLDVSLVNHLDANLSALIMAMATKLQVKSNVSLRIKIGKGQDIFLRNGLISHLEGHGNNNRYADDRKSSIALTSFKPFDEDFYRDYLANRFFAHRSLDHIPQEIKDVLRDLYLEVFTNIGLHANTKLPVFACGQYFPVNKALKFTLVDLGEGFLKKIRVSTKGRVTKDESAIVWATEGANSTKDKSIHGPGGTGLKELKKYCDTNNGSLHICSGAGYVCFKDRKFIHCLSTSFRGSIISIVMRNI